MLCSVNPAMSWRGEVALVALVCGGLATLELRDARSALDFHRDFIEAGGTVVVVEATDGQGIDAARSGRTTRRPR